LTLVAAVMCAFAFALLSPTLTAQTMAGASTTGVSITGTVTIAGDRGPARRAGLTLTGAAYPTGVMAIADDQGRYEFRGVLPGRYTLSATKPGFVTAYLGATRPGRGPGVPLDVRDVAMRADLTLLPGAVIAGTVRDALNRPRTMMVTAIQRRIANSEIVMQPVQSVTASSHGEYRLYGLAPGTYFVVAWPGPLYSGARVPTDAEFAAAARGQAMSSVSLARSSGGAISAPQNVVYAPTIYPGVTDAAQAVAIELAAGEERLGFDITARLVPSARLQGRVVDPSGQIPRHLQLSLLTPEQALGYQNREVNGVARPAAVVVTKDGAFTRAALAPGRYTFLARAANTHDSQPTLWAMARLDVNGMDIPDFVIWLERALTVGGRVAFDAAPGTKKADAARVQVRLIPTANVALGVAPVRPTADGAFVLSGVAGGRYRVDASLDGWTLVSVRRGDEELIDSGLTLAGGHDVSDVVLTLSNRAPGIAGRLINARDEPATEFSVVVMPADPAQWRATSRLVRLVRPSTDGRYAIDGLAAGGYLIAAVSDGDGFDFGEPGVFEALAANALRLTLGDHERRTLDLRVGIQK
jgi:hypothetical protein